MCSCEGSFLLTCFCYEFTLRSCPDLSIKKAEGKCKWLFIPTGSPLATLSQGNYNSLPVVKYVLRRTLQASISALYSTEYSSATDHTIDCIVPLQGDTSFSYRGESIGIALPCQPLRFNLTRWALDNPLGGPREWPGWRILGSSSARPDRRSMRVLVVDHDQSKICCRLQIEHKFWRNENSLSFGKDHLWERINISRHAEETHFLEFFIT